MLKLSPGKIGSEGLSFLSLCPNSFFRKFMAVRIWLLTLGLGDGGEIYILPPERQPNKELKYRISTKVHQRIFSPELLMNSEQKADEMHVTPRYCQTQCCVHFHFCNVPKSEKIFFISRTVNEEMSEISVLLNFSVHKKNSESSVIVLVG